MGYLKQLSCGFFFYGVVISNKCNIEAFIVLDPCQYYNFYWNNATGTNS